MSHRESDHLHLRLNPHHDLYRHHFLSHRYLYLQGLLYSLSHELSHFYWLIFEEHPPLTSNRINHQLMIKPRKNRSYQRLPQQRHEQCLIQSKHLIYLFGINTLNQIEYHWYFHSKHRLTPMAL